jgi:hypothetical protein
MGSTLQDQFLKMGLVDKKQVNTVKKARHEQRSRQGGTVSPDESKIQAQQSLAEKKAYSRRLNQAKNKELQEQESAARIRQLVDSHRLPLDGGETPYNFTDNNKIKRLFLPKEIVEQLSGGALAIVRQAGGYQIVPAIVAKKVQEFNTKLVVVYHAPEEKPSSDREDPYAEYQVPDDLVW